MLRNSKKRVRAVVVSFALAGVSVALMGMGHRPPHVYIFPPDFIWGAATSSYQVEGGNTLDDWYQWEQMGHTKDHAGKADDEYHLYPEDLDLAQKLNLNVFRMSIEWSRIEPEQGVFDDKEIEHYREELQAAHDRGLKTFVTLHHWTNPIWAANQGGWTNDQMPEWFAEYVARVVPALGDLVDDWLTINEPNVNVLEGYLMGIVPPGEQDITKAPIALAEYLKAHARAYHIIHHYFPNAKVSFAHHVRVFDPSSGWNPLDRLAASFIDDFWNHQLIRSIQSGDIHFSIPFVINYHEVVPELKGTLDFLGLNYYTREMIKFDMNSPIKIDPYENPDPKVGHGDNGDEIYPECLHRMLLAMSGYGLPIYITENGVADAADTKRAQFICDHLKAIGDAMEDGVDVRGYIHWALIDNYEWVRGFQDRFGLIDVDYSTEARYIRSSAELFSRIAASNSLEACKLSP